MNFIKTKSFQLATYAKGDVSSPKLALVLPGRLDTKDYIHMTSLVDHLAELGYYAVSFDMPGTWDSPGDIANYSTTTYMQVVNELIEYFGNKPTLLVGHSRGGTVSILAADNPHVSGIVVIMATFAEPSGSHPEMSDEGFEVSYRDLPPGSIRTDEKKVFKLPNSYFIDGAKYNPVSVLQNLTKPKLIIYGDNDSFTKPERVEEVFATLPDPKMIYKVNSRHDYRLHDDVIDEVNNVVSSFLEKHFR